MLAFERHATSKLRTADDLLSIATLGFRGEALPSIASVSRVLLETAEKEGDAGTRLEIAGGKILRVEDAALPAGTSISIQDLFFNTPARRKFLRAESTELSHVVALVTHLRAGPPGKTLRTALRYTHVAASPAGHPPSRAHLPDFRRRYPRATAASSCGIPHRTRRVARAPPWKQDRMSRNAILASSESAAFIQARAAKAQPQLHLYLCE